MIRFPRINDCSGICKGRPENCPEDCVLYTGSGGAFVNRGTGLHTTFEAEESPASEVRDSVNTLMNVIFWLGSICVILVFSFLAGFFFY